MENKKSLLFRVDATHEMGIGHVMRCLVIAEAWMKKDLGPVYFISSSLNDKMKSLVEKANIKLCTIQCNDPGSTEDALATIELIRKLNSDWVVVDGYQFNHQYQECLKNHNVKFLFFDDFGHCDHYVADIVLNRGFFANQVDYTNREPYTKLLLGHTYSLIRNDFIDAASEKERDAKQVGKILVTIGGSDPKNVTVRVLEALDRLEQDLSIKVILGPLYRDQEELMKRSYAENHQVEMIHFTNRIVDYYKWADVAITAGGNSLYEMLYMGLPTITIKTASNQNAVKIISEEYQATFYVGDEQQLSTELLEEKTRFFLNNTTFREEIARAAEKLIDGLGVQRVINEMIEVNK